MLNFRTAISGLRASQIAIDTISNNIANANTPGYSRQNVTLVDQFPINDRGLWIGTGVEATRINRIASGTIETALHRNIAAQGHTSSVLDVQRQIESILSPTSGSISDKLQKFFDDAQSLQSQPHDATHRNQLINSSRALAGEFNRANNQLAQLQRSASRELRQTVEHLNQQLGSLFEINRQISIAESRGTQPNDLIDRHQQLVAELSDLIGLESTKADSGFDYQLANFSISSSKLQIEFEFSSDGQVQFHTGSGLTLQLESGRLAGLQESINSEIAGVSQEINLLATEFIQQVNKIHGTGINGNGPFGLLHSTRSIADSKSPLADQVGPLSIQDGELFISVTDKNSGERVLSQIFVDPETHTLSDVASAISDIDNIQAVINSQTGKLSILAAEGFAFDFAGQLETAPDRTNITGDANIEFLGRYTGPENDQFQFKVLGSGTVGVTDSLSIQVTNSFGQELGTFNVGAGYEPGAAIELPNGVKIKFDSGTLNDGDSFATQVVADSDTAGILSALGLNSLFVGQDAGSISINPDIQADERLLSLARSTDSGDGENAARLFALRDKSLFENNNTIQQQYNFVAGETGIEVNNLNTQASTLQLLHNRLQGEREAISGVDQNEELVRMLQFQESFQASLRVISTIDTMLSDLMTIIR